MKKILLTTALIISANAAFADEYKTKVYDVFKNERIQTPRTVTGCHIVDVPIYGERTHNGTAAEAITGGVIGGAIGNQFGKGSGNDVMTILGVILGANAADRKETYVEGYHKEERCSEDVVYEESIVKTYRHSVVEFYREGKKHELRFQK